MSIAVQLRTLADNVPRVAQVVNAARVRLEGAAVRADGVAEIPLKVQVKNKNLLSAPTLDAERDKNRVLFEGSITGDFVFSCVFDYSECKAPTAAQFSFVVDGVEKYMSRGTMEKRETTFSGTLTKITFLNWGYGVGSVGQIQLEYGTVSTDYTPHIEDFTGVGVKVFGKNLLSVLPKWGQTLQNNASPIYLEAGQRYTFSFEGQYTAWRLMFYGTRVDGSPFPYNAQSGDYDSGRFIAGCYTTPNTDGTTRLQWEYNLTGNHRVITCNESIIVTAMQFWVTGTELTPYSHAQLELGSVATDFEPYKAPKTAKADSTGKVTGLAPVVPTMTVLASSGVVQLSYLPEGEVSQKYQAYKNALNELKEEISHV